LRRISSYDSGYATGDLSLFPSALDDRDSLYEVRNNAETQLRSGLSYNARQIVVDSAVGFPDKGLIRVGPPAGKPGEAELIYYGLKTDSVFKDLTRGFSGSKQNQWPSGSWVTNAVTAEPHNAVKDALINMQRRVGLSAFPEADTTNRRLRDMELKYLSPKALFKAFPRSCRPGEPIRFQNFSEGDVVRYLWDFGDGGQNVEENPVYSYPYEGTYTVKLHIITASGAQGIYTKTDYLTVSAQQYSSFFYVVPAKDSYGVLIPRTYRFVDQTEGYVTQRFWVFGPKPEQKYVESDPNIHEHVYTYDEPGVYTPSLLVGFANQSVQRVFLNEELTVS